MKGRAIVNESGSLLPKRAIVHINSLGGRMVGYTTNGVEDGIADLRHGGDVLPEDFEFTGTVLRMTTGARDFTIDGDAVPAMGLSDAPHHALELLLILREMLLADHVMGWPDAAIAWNVRRRCSLGAIAMKEDRLSGETLSTPWETGFGTEHEDGVDPEEGHRTIPDDPDACGPRPMIIGLKIQDVISTTHVRIDRMSMRRIRDIDAMEAMRAMAAWRNAA